MCYKFLCCCCCSRRKGKMKISEETFNLKQATTSKGYYEAGNVMTDSKDTMDGILVAKYNYRNSEKDCLEVKKRDRFTIIDSDDSDWNLVKNLETNDVGYAPANIFVNENSLLVEEWYFGKVARMEVEASLLLPIHADGTFLIRKSEENKKFPFVLSIKFDDPKKNGHVRHYRIFEEGSSRNYYISEELTFSSLAELVEAYKNNELLCTRLLKPCKSPGPTLGTLSPNHKHWEIPKTELQVSKDRKLGRGQFSTVFHGTWNRTTDVAIKIIRNENEIMEILKEVNIMKKLKHKNLITLYGICSISKPFWIISEYLDHGDLLTLIRETDLRDEHNIYISYQITDGMSYLESNNIVHRDLAARNILLGENGVVKVADLGLSRKTDGDGNYILTSELKLPIRWMAPESFTTAVYSSKCDVWSFAILLTELYTNGAKPYPELNNAEVVVKVQGGYRMPKPQKMSRNIYEIVCKCWTAAPNKRPSFEKLKMTFEALYEKCGESA